MFNVFIVLEEEVVMENVGDFTNAFIVLFQERINEEYNELKYMFVFIQKVFLNFGTESSRKVQSLRIKLL